MIPLDVATEETVRFVAAHVPRGSMVLEIGCGAGDVAAELQGRGYGITGIDADPRAVRQTLAKGVRAVVAGWPAAIVEHADAVLFTRSLHHVGDLRGAIDAVYRAVRPAGSRRTSRLEAGAPQLLVEDFDFSAADARVVQWLTEKADAAREEGLLVGEFTWDDHHDADLHTAEAILEAVRERFEVVVAEDVPYAYRYLVAVLERSARAAAWLRTVVEEERSRGSAIGRRIVARVPSVQQ